MLPVPPLFLQSKANSASEPAKDTLNTEPSAAVKDPHLPPQNYERPSPFRPSLALRAGAMVVDGQEAFNPSVNGSLFFGKNRFQNSSFIGIGPTLGVEGFFGDSRTSGGLRIGPKAIYQSGIIDRGIHFFIAGELCFTAGGGELSLPLPDIDGPVTRGTYYYSGGDFVFSGGINFLSLYLKGGVDAEHRTFPGNPPRNAAIVYKLGGGVDVTFQ